MVLGALVLEFLVHPGQTGLRVQVEGRRLEPLVAHTSAGRQTQIELGDLVLLDTSGAVQVEMLGEEVVVFPEDEPVVDGRLALVGVRVLLPSVVVRAAQGDPVDLASPYGVHAQAEALGLGVAGGDQRVADQRPGPFDPRLVDACHVLERDHLWTPAGDRHDLHGAVGPAGDLRAERRVAGLDHDGLVGREGLHLRQIHGDLAGGLALDRELAAVGADDLAAEPVAVEKQDLVGRGPTGHDQ